MHECFSPTWGDRLHMKSSCLQGEVKVQGRCPRKDLRLKEKKDSKEICWLPLTQPQAWNILEFNTCGFASACVSVQEHIESV